MCDVYIYRPCCCRFVLYSIYTLYTCSQEIPSSELVPEELGSFLIEFPSATPSSLILEVNWPGLHWSEVSFTDLQLMSSAVDPLQIRRTCVVCILNYIHPTEHSINMTQKEVINTWSTCLQ